MLVDVKAQIVDVDVPLIIGLDVLFRLKAVLDFSDYKISSVSGKWKITLSNKLGHAYIEWNDIILHTE